MRTAIVVMLVLAILLSGCGSSSQNAQNALKNTAVAPGAVGDTGNSVTLAATAAGAALTPGPAPTALPQNTSTPIPQKTATPVPQNLKLSAKGLGQERQEVAFAFEIENPNPGLAVESSQYQAAVYDKAGTVLKSDSGYIELLLPGQKFGVAGTVYLSDAEQIADHVEVQVKPGRFSAADPQPSFAADKVNYVKGSYSSHVTGLIKSPYKKDASNVKVYVLAYNSAGALIGGGYTYLNFVPAEGQAPAEISVVTSGEPARVQVFASLSGLSSFGGAASSAPDAQNIKLLTKGYGQDGQYAGYAFLVENPNTSVAVESSQYQVAAYAKDGSVLKSGDGYIEVLLPGQKLGIGGDLMLPEKTSVIDHLDIQVKPGKFTPAQPQQPFASDKATFIQGDYKTVVTGIIKSPYPKDTSHVRASAIAYDDKGAIIGGGYTYVEFLPASEQAGVSVSVKVAKVPARVELYAAVTALSQIVGAGSQAAKDIKLGAFGFGQERTRVAYGFLVENTNASAAIESSRYQVAAFAKDGTVLDADSGYIDLLLPGQKLGVAGNLSLPGKNGVVDHIVVQVKAGDPKPSDQAATFTADKATYVKGSYSSKITGVIKSPYQKDASRVKVYALAYDASGAILGGGYDYLDFVPAGGQTAADVSVITSAQPAKVELYASLSGLSEFK